MASRAGTGTCFKIDAEIFFGEVRLVWATGHSCYQGALRIKKGLAGSAVSVRTVPDRLVHRNTGVVLALLYQFQGSGSIRSIASQDIDSGNELGIGINRYGRLMPVKAFAAALVTVPHLRIMDRDNSIAAHPFAEVDTVVFAFDILKQKLSQ
jgi:hypothetical protein